MKRKQTKQIKRGGLRTHAHKESRWLEVLAITVTTIVAFAILAAIIHSGLTSIAN